MLDDLKIDGGKIRVLRERRGWSQRDLWRESGVDQGTISNLETDQKEDVRFSTMVALAHALGVQPEDLLASAESIETKPNDPQINVMMRLVNDMTREERESAVSFMNWVIAQRRRATPAKKNSGSDVGLHRSGLRVARRTDR